MQLMKSVFAEAQAIVSVLWFTTAVGSLSSSLSVIPEHQLVAPTATQGRCVVCHFQVTLSIDPSHTCKLLVATVDNGKLAIIFI